MLKPHYCRRDFISTFALLLVLRTLVVAAEIPAFPGAEGFGAHAQGGRGGQVLAVTNLNDAGPGSLRECVEREGPRTIVFRVSGIIELKSALTVREPYLTIAGQTAPGDGICLKNFGFSVSTHEVIVRHLRVRPGDELGPVYRARGKGFSPDAISIGSPARSIIFDHCSASWSIDECLSVSGEGITDVTVQWCLIAESLNDSFHTKGPHGYGSLLRCNGDITFHHNIYAHHSSRSPRPGTYGDGSILLDFRNNVVYDSKGYSAADPVRMNYIGNFIRRPRDYVFSIGGETTRMFVDGNYLDNGENDGDNWSLISRAKPANKVARPFPVAPVITQTAQDAFQETQQTCGATLPKRDAVDTRIIDQIRTGRGKLIDSQEQVGGWPRLQTATAPMDHDNDGMPDTWEKRFHLDASVSGRAVDTDRDGYTDLEEFLNGTNPTRKD
jgi:pectate lyase